MGLCAGRTIWRGGSVPGTDITGLREIKCLRVSLQKISQQIRCFPGELGSEKKNLFLHDHPQIVWECVGSPWLLLIGRDRVTRTNKKKEGDWPAYGESVAGERLLGTKGSVA